jgi:hypothetical protein
VLTFNRLFKAIRRRRGHDSNAVKATWVNITFSYGALQSLTKGTPHDPVLPRPPRDANQGKPGLDLLWPGEFVFGYEYQDPTKKVEDPSST